jgi:hypothetical protein
MLSRARRSGRAFATQRLCTWHLWGVILRGRRHRLEGGLRARVVLRSARVDARAVELRRQLLLPGLLVLRLLVGLELVEAGQVAAAERVRQPLHTWL